MSAKQGRTLGGSMVAVQSAWSLAEEGVLAEQVPGTKGVLSIYRLGARHFGTIASGYLEARHADALLHYADKLLPARHIVAFHDWFAVTGYEPAGRTRITAWGAKNLAAIEAVHLGTSDRLLTLGATLVNAVFRGRMTIHRSRETLQAAWRSKS